MIVSLFQRIGFSIILMGFSLSGSAQFVAVTTINASVSPTTLIQNDFLGPGITVSNITSNIPSGASNRQFARFSNANSPLPFSSGIILSSGFSDSYNNQGNTSANFGNDLFAAGDTDLDSIVFPSTTFDAAVLEFDFIPLGDSIRFRFVFASEEYPEYACAVVNDPFGVFLSGPGITGSQNMAIVPGSAPPLPVSINTINPGNPGASASFPHNCVAPDGSLAYSSLYVSNAVSTNFEFDGLTTVIEIVAAVIPCSTYHIKLAVADAFDGVFDSAVFLEANSFTSEYLDIRVLKNRPDSLITEGCGDNPQILFSLPYNVSSVYPIPLSIFGTASNGSDYSLLPDTVFINPGDSTASISIDVQLDSLAESLETIFIAIQNNSCLIDTLEFIIVDASVSSTKDTTIVQHACDNFSYNNQNYTISGNYIHHLSTFYGCDSVVTLQLQVDSSKSLTLNESSCDSFLLNGQSYYADGNYVQNYSTTMGCDSIIYLNIDILSSSNTLNVQSCNSYNLNGQIYNSSGNYQQTLINSVGCDSNLVLNLYIGSHSSDSLQIDTCNSFLLNNINYTQSGNYVQIINNYMGCDSTIYLDLHLDSIDLTLTVNGMTLQTNETAANYQWVDCNLNFAPIAGATAQSFSPQQNGNYALIISKFNCSMLSACENITGLGINPQNLQNLKIYPNPTTDLLNIERTQSKQLSILLQDKLGRILLSRESEQPLTELNMRDFLPGIYYLSVNDGVLREVYKVVLR